MRWKEKKVDEKPFFGQERIISKFALFPIHCTNGEVVWLEKINIKQRYKNGVDYIIGLGRIDDWVDIERFPQKLK